MSRKPSLTPKQDREIRKLHELDVPFTAIGRRFEVNVSPRTSKLSPLSYRAIQRSLKRTESPNN